MTDLWKQAAEEAEAASAGANLKLKDGEKVVVAFFGSPKVKTCAFVDGQYYEGADIPHGVTPGKRFAVQVVNVKLGVVQEFVMSSTTFKKLCLVKGKYGLDKNCFEISRTGSGMQDTEYTILPDAPLDDALKAIIALADDTVF